MSLPLFVPFCENGPYILNLLLGKMLPVLYNQSGVNVPVFPTAENKFAEICMRYIFAGNVFMRRFLTLHVVFI